MLSTASDRVRTGWPPRRRSDTVSTRPARMRQTSVDVPPISKVTASATPVRAPTACAAATPPAGPDISIASGTLRAPAGVAMPPLDCVSRSGARSPAPLIAEQRREAPRLGLVERDQDAARMIDALGHLEPQRARHDRRLPARQVEAVQMIALLPADLQHVAEPPRRDQGGPRPPPLQHRVGRHGR